MCLDVVLGTSGVAPSGHSPVAVDMQQDVRGADSQCQPVPLLVGQAVWEDLGVGLLSPTLVVQPQFTALPTALQLQEPARPQVKVQVNTLAAPVLNLSIIQILLN